MDFTLASLASGNTVAKGKGVGVRPHFHCRIKTQDFCKTPVKIAPLILLFLAACSKPEQPKTPAPLPELPKTNAAQSVALPIPPPAVLNEKRPATREVAGQVFIVKNDGNSVKLGGVEVFAVDDAAFIRERLLEANEKRQRSYAALEAQFSVLERAFNAAKSLESLEKMEAITEQRRAILKQMKKFSVGWFFFSSPVRSACGKTTTDADGNFKLTLPTDKECHLLCSASRRILDDIEQYYWVVEVPAATVERILLSNNNKL